MNSSPEAIGVVNKILTSEAALQALTEKVPLVSEPYIGVTGRFIILVSVPIFNTNGEYEGFIGGSIYLNEPNVFEAMLGTHTSNNSGSYVFVISKKGELLYHPDLERVGDVVLANEVVQKVVAGEIGERIVVNTKGVEMLAGYAPVLTAQWGIVSQTPVSNIDAASRELVVKIFLYAIPVIVVLLLIAILLIRYLSRPLQKLASFAEALDADQMDRIPRIHHWNYEANQLHKTMEKAVGAMQTQINSLAQEAHKDTLTGLNNRRTMEKVLQTWLQSDTPFCYIILDIDHFKSVNDTFGHHMGDEVLKFLAQKLLEHAGEKDVSCRFGGEEFVVLTPDGNLDKAYLLAERIRQNIEQSANPIGRPITVSAGVASSVDNQGDIEAVKQRADVLLYKSKQSGRNRVSIG